MFDTCQACARKGDLIEVLSVLDYKNHMLCGTCIDNKAETFKAFRVSVLNWKQIPKQVRESFTMHAGNGVYVSPKDFMKRMLHQQLVLAEPAKKARRDEREKKKAELAAERFEASMLVERMANVSRNNWIGTRTDAFFKNRTKRQRPKRFYFF